MRLDSGNGQFNVVLNEKKCIEPVGESKSDYEIVCLIAEKLGLLEKLTGGKTIEELIKLGFETSGVQKVMHLRGIRRKGVFCRPDRPGMEGISGWFEKIL